MSFGPNFFSVFTPHPSILSKEFDDERNGIDGNSTCAFKPRLQATNPKYIDLMYNDKANVLVPKINSVLK